MVSSSSVSDTRRERNRCSGLSRSASAAEREARIAVVMIARLLSQAAAFFRPAKSPQTPPERANENPSHTAYRSHCDMRGAGRHVRVSKIGRSDSKVSLIQGAGKSQRNLRPPISVPEALEFAIAGQIRFVQR